jgi:hypothetical protein
MGSSRGVWGLRPQLRGSTPTPRPKLGDYSYTVYTKISGEP